MKVYKAFQIMYQNTVTARTESPDKDHILSEVKSVMSGVEYLSLESPTK
jgi:hypothetical protein